MVDDRNDMQQKDTTDWAKPMPPAQPAPDAEATNEDRVPEDQRDRLIAEMREQIEKMEVKIKEQSDKLVKLLTEASVIADVVRAKNEINPEVFEEGDDVVIIDEESRYFQELGKLSGRPNNYGQVEVELLNGLRREFHVGTETQAQIKLLGKDDGTNVVVSTGGEHYVCFGIPGLKLNPGDAVTVNMQSKQVINKTDMMRMGEIAVVTNILDDETIEVGIQGKTRVVLRGPTKYEEVENVATEEVEVAEAKTDPTPAAPKKFGAATTVTSDEINNAFSAVDAAIADPETGEPADTNASPEVETVAEVEDGAIVGGEALEEVELKIGDRLLLDRACTVVIRHLPRDDGRHKLEHFIDVSFNDIAGLETAKEAVKECIEYPVTQKELYEFFGKKPPKGILLFGAPGNGKTMLGKAITKRLCEIHSDLDPREVMSSAFIYVKGPELLDKWVGNTEAHIRALFIRGEEHYEKYNFPAVLFIDEADAILPQRGRHHGSYDIAETAVPMFLSMMDGLNESHVLVVLATNRPMLLDPAAIREGRCDRHIKVDRPNIDSATDYFVIHMRQVPLAGQPRNPEGDPEESPEEWNAWRNARNKLMIPAAARASAEVFSRNRTLYSITDGKAAKELKFCLGDACTGAMLAGIVDEASSIAMKRMMMRKEGEPLSGITMKDLCDAVEKVYRQHIELNHNFDLEEFCDIHGIDKQTSKITKQAGDY